MVTRQSLTSLVLASFWSSVAFAGITGTPQFIVSSINDTDVVPIPAALLPVQNSVSFAGASLQSTGIEQIPEAGTQLTNGTLNVQNGFTNDQIINNVHVLTVNNYDMQGTPATLDAEILNHASSINDTAFVSTGVGLEKWYVLTGAGTGTVNLRFDMAFQGQLTGFGPGDPRAFFNGTVYLLSHPGATSATIPLALDAHRIVAGDDTNFGNPMTVPGVNSTFDISINDIIRSNPFQVQVNVPFGILFSLSAAATTGLGSTTTTAETNFFDPSPATSTLFPDVPQLTPDGFGIDTTDGNVDPLSSHGLTLEAISVPEPTSIFLSIFVLGGLMLIHRRPGRSKPVYRF